MKSTPKRRRLPSIEPRQRTVTRSDRIPPDRLLKKRQTSGNRPETAPTERDRKSPLRALGKCLKKVARTRISQKSKRTSWRKKRKEFRLRQLWIAVSPSGGK